MFASTVLNYMDRQAIALVSPQVRREFGIDFEGFGWLLTAFGLSYALFQIPAGLMADRLRVRLVYPAAVAFWSLAAMGGGLAPTLGVLIVLRALLGLGESFNWPCALRVTSRILPPRDRSLGNGIFNSGAAIGAVLTPLTVPLLARAFGWRAAFLVIGALGFAWVAAWLLLTRRVDGIDRIERVEAAPVSSGMGGAGRVGFGLVALAALGVAGWGFLRPVELRVPADRVRPEGPVEFLRWLDVPGVPVKRGSAVAEFRLGETTLRLNAPDDGRIGDRAVEPGAAVDPGAVIGEFVDPVGPRPMTFRALVAATGIGPVRWTVAPGVTVAAGDAVGEAEVAGRTVRIESGEGGVVDRVEGDGLRLRVDGFHPKAMGLQGVWLGVATLMIGALVAARIVGLGQLGGGWARSLGEVARLRRFWILVLVSGTINVCWHFLVNWLPTYLQTDRSMAYLAGGLWSALPFLAADVGNLAGGAASRELAARRGIGAARARLAVMSGCAVLVSLGALVGWMPRTGWGQAGALGLLALMAVGAAAYMANYFAFCQEVEPRHTGLIVGYLGGLGNLFAAGFNPVAGRIKDSSGEFTAVFVVVGLVPFLGLAALWLGWGKDRRSGEGAGP
jgi:sugar phosphate permease